MILTLILIEDWNPNHEEAMVNFRANIMGIGKAKGLGQTVALQLSWASRLGFNLSMVAQF